MGILRTLTLATSLFGLHAVQASPALAAVGLVEEDLSPGLSDPRKAASSGIDCAALIAPSFGATHSAMTAPALSKSAAILGGQTSRLEQMAMQQAAPQPAVPALVVASAGPDGGNLPGEGLEPAAGGSRCADLASARSREPVFAPGTLHAPLGADDFLASKRLPIARTAFDAAWGRVRSSSLPRALSKEMGRLGKGEVTREGIAAINSWTNAKIRYVEDRELYGRPDFWATARMTLHRRAGDCEDIAIAKMQLLAALGVRREDMFLTIARDLARNADHALLVVRHQEGYLLLDNATDQLLDGTSSHDYRPIMSFNTSGKWLHGY